VRALTDPALTPFRVAGGDWSPSPDGNRVVFVSADDHNLWVMDVPLP
jgi:Tol biopolymer transport system component